MKFHQKMVLFAQKKRFSQRDLAAEASRFLEEIGERGISSSSMNRFWNGERVPDLNESWAIAKALGVSLDFLADEWAEAERSEDRMSDDELMVLELYRSLNIEKTDAIRAFYANRPFRKEAAGGEGELFNVSRIVPATQREIDTLDALVDKAKTLKEKQLLQAIIDIKQQRIALFEAYASEQVKTQGGLIQGVYTRLDEEGLRRLTALVYEEGFNTGTYEGFIEYILNRRKGRRVGVGEPGKQPIPHREEQSRQLRHRTGNVRLSLAEAPRPSPLRVGAVVRHKKGGPRMTVEYLSPYGPNRWSCCWFEGSLLKREPFEGDDLIVLPD